MNLVILHGNLGADPDLRLLSNGQAKLELRLVTNERYEHNGEWKERSEWHKVVMWGRRGEHLAKHLSKGSRILVRGSITSRSYDKDGEKRYITEIKADDISFAGDGRGASQSGRQERRQRGHSQPQRLQTDLSPPPPPEDYEEGSDHGAEGF